LTDIERVGAARTATHRPPPSYCETPSLPTGRTGKPAQQPSSLSDLGASGRGGEDKGCYKHCQPADSGNAPGIARPRPRQRQNAWRISKNAELDRWHTDAERILARCL